MNKENSVIHISESDINLKHKLINVFLQNQESIVALNNDQFITYDSFINSVRNGSSLKITIDELAIYTKEKNNKDNSEWKNTSIDLTRWKCLYANNDKIINYLRSRKPKKVFVRGGLSQELFNYINVYGNEFSTSIIPIDYDNYLSSILEEKSLLIDTDLFSMDLKQEINRHCRFDKDLSSSILNINELCNEAEIYYFVNSFLKNQSFETYVFEFPDNEQFTELTFAEQLRMKAKVNYIYYLSNYMNDPEIRNLVETFMGDLFTEDYIDKENLSPGTILKNGICRLADSDNDFCKSINGIRYTTDKSFDYAFDINIFGPCMVYGALVDDKHTIASYLQRKVNVNNMDYSVNNYGLRAMELPEQVRIADNVNIKHGDKMIFIISTEEKEKLARLGFTDVETLLPVFNNNTLHNYFLDKPAHCNHIANGYIADYIYDKIKKNLLTINPQNKESAVPVKRNQKRNVFSNNKFIDEYLSMLKGLDIPDGPNGAILMNCNPFTYGHYNLIKYASLQVEELFVIVVQDDKSVFKFEDRYKMVQNGCKDFSNVTVIPSGKIFGSSMIFPEYFNREEKTDVTIDVSLDREIFTDYIAPTLNVKKRFVGEEKTDIITASYNRELKNNLPLYGIEVIEIPRFTDRNGQSISAKTVRNALENNDWDTISQLVPPTTIEILQNYSNDIREDKVKEKKLQA